MVRKLLKTSTLTTLLSFLLKSNNNFGLCTSMPVCLLDASLTHDAWVDKVVLLQILNKLTQLIPQYFLVKFHALFVNKHTQNGFNKLRSMVSNSLNCALRMLFYLRKKNMLEFN